MTSAAADRFMWKPPSLLLASSFLLERVAPMHFSVLPSSLLLCKKYFTVFCLSEQKDSKFSQQQQKIHYPFFSTAGSVFCYFPDIWYCKLHKQGAWEINKFLDLPAWRKGLQFLICVSLSNSNLPFPLTLCYFCSLWIAEILVWKTTQHDKGTLWDCFT